MQERLKAVAALAACLTRQRALQQPSHQVVHRAVMPSSRVVQCLCGLLRLALAVARQLPVLRLGCDAVALAPQCLQNAAEEKGQAKE